VMILYLIALVSVVGATAPATITPPPADCFTKYKCVMPKNCLAGAPLIDVEDTSDFKPDCFVFLKFHPFSPNWYRIIMRSVVDTAKIEFTYKHGLTEEHVFICEKDETTTPPSVKISHKKAQDTPKEVDVIKHELTNSFTCEFDADLRGETLAADFTLTKATATVHSSLPSSAPKKTDPRTVEMNLYYCMPSALLTPRDNFKSDLRYAKNIITTTLLPELPTKTANFDKLVLIKKKNDEFKGKGKRKLEKYTFPEDSEAYKDLKIQLTPAITNQFSAIMRPSQKAGATTPLSPPTPLNNVESLTPQSPPAPQPTK
ncbi:hypothetical protein PFISCL1PPCAC_25954, partial [Pristionchus fissidentatus]